MSNKCRQTKQTLNSSGIIQINVKQLYLFNNHVDLFG